MKLFTCLALAAIAMASASAAATKDECDFACPDVENPVCGSDGKTYSNKCYLSLASCKSSEGITKASDGECTASSGTENCDFLCLDQYDPVTDDDGNEYSNECYMRLAKCEEKEKGNTNSSSSASSAASEASSTTGSSDSGSESTDFPVFKPGKCDFACPMVMRPVTDENGKSYSNECVMRAAKCREGEGGATTKPILRGDEDFGTIDV